MEDLYQRTESRGNKTYHEGIISIVPLPYYWGCIVLGGLFLLVSLTLLTYFEKSYEYAGISIILSILFAWQNIAIIWAHNKTKTFRDTFISIIELPEQDIVKWYNDQERIIFDNRGMAAAGVLIILVMHMLGVDYLGLSFKSTIANIFIIMLYYLNSYITGVGLYIIVMTALAVHKIGKLPLNANILLSNSIQAIGVLYSKFTICASSVYIIWGIFHIFTPQGLASLQRLLWFASLALLLCAYFIIPQHSIHHMIVKTKNDRTEIFSMKLRYIANESLNRPTKENLSYLKDLLDIQHKLDEMSEWPFSIYEILHIALITIIPLIVVTLEVLFGVVK